MLDVGVIGLGTMGADHVRTLGEQVPGVRVRAVHDLSAGRAAEIAEASGARVVASATELIAAEDVQAVVIASPDPTHAELTLACVTAGKPVLCEKPLGVGAAESARVLAAEEAAGRRLVSVGFMRRFDPGYLALREAVRDGAVGTPLLVHNTHRNAAPHPSATSEGVVANSMIHELDILPWLTGMPVTALEVRSPRREGLRDPQLALVELGDGQVLATVEVFLAAGYGYEVRCEVVGTEGTARLRGPGRLEVARGQRDGRVVAPDYRDRFGEAYRRELVAWAVAAARGTTAGATAIDGHRANVVAAAGIASLTGDGRVAVAAEAGD